MIKSTPVALHCIYYGERMKNEAYFSSLKDAFDYTDYMSGSLRVGYGLIFGCFHSSELRVEWNNKVERLLYYVVYGEGHQDRISIFTDKIDAEEFAKIKNVDLVKSTFIKYTMECGQTWLFNLEH